MRRVLLLGPSVQALLEVEVPEEPAMTLPELELTSDEVVRVELDLVTMEHKNYITLFKAFRSSGRIVDSSCHGRKHNFTLGSISWKEV